MRCSAAGSCLVIVFAAGQLMGQDSDTVVLKNNDQKFTLVSQIEDPQEAAAFLALLGTNEPALRYELANIFWKRYPQSWLLPQAYAVAAGSAIDLGKNQEALETGRFSLRLVPENPSLLILLANIEAQQSLFDRAIEELGFVLDAPIPNQGPSQF